MMMLYPFESTEKLLKNPTVGLVSSSGPEFKDGSSKPNMARWRS